MLLHFLASLPTDVIAMAAVSYRRWEEVLRKSHPTRAGINSHFKSESVTETNLSSWNPQAKHGLHQILSLAAHSRGITGLPSTLIL